MNKMPEPLRILQELLEGSSMASYFKKVERENWHEVLHLRNTWEKQDHDHIIYILLTEGSPTLFDYLALSNEHTEDPEQYQVISEGIRVDLLAIRNMVYRVLTPQINGPGAQAIPAYLGSSLSSLAQAYSLSTL